MGGAAGARGRAAGTGGRLRRRRPGCRQGSVPAAGGSCGPGSPALRPRRHSPGDNVSLAGTVALPARLRVKSKHRGRRRPPFFLSRQPVNRLPPCPSRASAPRLASLLGSARETLLPGLGHPLTWTWVFCLFLLLPAISTLCERCPLPPLPSVATQQHDTGGVRPEARCLL